MKRAIFSSLLGLILTIAIVAIVAIAQPNFAAHYPYPQLATVPYRLHHYPLSKKVVATGGTLSQVRGELGRVFANRSDFSHLGARPIAATPWSANLPCTCPSCQKTIAAQTQI